MYRRDFIIENNNINSIDLYISSFPEPVQSLLQELREAIKESAPEALEKISYQMPTFYLQGNLVHFAGYKNHIGFYPAPSGIEAFKEELSSYKGAKGSALFPLDKPLPIKLIKEIVKFRAAENILAVEEKLKDKRANKVVHSSPDSYILEQPIDRQNALNILRRIIKENIPKGFKEVIQYGMIGFVVPKDIYKEGYHVTPSEPLPFLGLANQKGYIAFYHLGIYADESLKEWFVKSYESLKIGKLDMGKSCIRFKNIDKIPYDLLGELCTKITVEDYIKIYETSKLKK